MVLKYVRVASLDQVPPGKSKGVRPMPGYRIALCNLGGTIYAIDDVCSHAGGIMHYGDIQGDFIQCPVHLGSFNVKTGEAGDPPVTSPIRTYPVRVDGGHIEVGIEE